MLKMHKNFVLDLELKCGLCTQIIQITLESISCPSIGKAEESRERMS